MASALRTIATRRILGTRCSSSHSYEQVEAACKLWEKLSMFVALPTVVFATYFILGKELKHHDPPPPFVPYEHLRIRRKNFPWGDGKKTLFHNPERNALPEGYEVDVATGH